MKCFKLSYSIAFRKALKAVETAGPEQAEACRKAIENNPDLLYDVLSKVDPSREDELDELSGKVSENSLWH
jgi:hypothetical protein